MARLTYYVVPARRTRSGKPARQAPKLKDCRQKKLCRMHRAGEYSTSDIADFFYILQKNIYLSLNFQDQAEFISEINLGHNTTKFR